MHGAIHERLGAAHSAFTQVASKLCGPRVVSRISDPASIDQAVVKLWRPPTAYPVQIFQILKLEMNNNVYT